MDVGLDEARRNETAAEIDRLALGRKPRLDSGDPAAGDADVGQLVLGADRGARFLRMSPSFPRLVLIPQSQQPPCARRDRPSAARGPARPHAPCPNA